MHRSDPPGTSCQHCSMGGGGNPSSQQRARGWCAGLVSSAGVVQDLFHQPKGFPFIGNFITIVTITIHQHQQHHHHHPHHIALEKLRVQEGPYEICGRGVRSLTIPSENQYFWSAPHSHGRPVQSVLSSPSRRGPSVPSCPVRPVTSVPCSPSPSRPIRSVLSSPSSPVRHVHS